MNMTPEQKIKWLILNRASLFAGKEPPTITAENVDAAYAALVESDGHWDAMEEVRCGDEETKVPCEWSRCFESKSVASIAPDGTWVGWTYWYGGGKHAEPGAVDWMDSAYDLDCKEEQKVVTVRTFTKRA